MYPLFACFPVCMTLSVIGFIGVIILTMDYFRGTPDEAQPETPAEPAEPKPLPPLWVFPFTLLIVAIVMAICAWIWPE